MKRGFSPSYDRPCVKMADRFVSRRYSLKNKLGDRMIKQINYLRKQKASGKSWSARHWQITIFYPTLCNNCFKLKFTEVEKTGPSSFITSWHSSTNIQWLYSCESLHKFAMLLVWITQNSLSIYALLKFRNQDAIFTWKTNWFRHYSHTNVWLAC